MHAPRVRVAVGSVLSFHLHVLSGLEFRLPDSTVTCPDAAAAVLPARILLLQAMCLLRHPMLQVKERKALGFRASQSQSELDFCPALLHLVL